MADFFSMASQIYQFTSSTTFLSGLSVGTIVGMLLKHFIEWFLTKYKTGRSEKEKRRLAVYDEMLKLIEEFDGNNKLVQYRLSHRNPDEEGRIFQQAIKEGKDPKQAIVNHIVPEGRPELVMIELGKCLGRIGDDEATTLVSDWAKALENCICAQMDFWKSRDDKLLPEKWTELLRNMESAWDKEIVTKKALLNYLRNCLL
jgi:hypothetical protein